MDFDFWLGLVKGVVSMPVSVRQIKTNKDMIDAPDRKRLPAHTDIYHARSLYRLVQAGSWLRDRPL